MDIQHLRDDASEGKLSIDKLIDVIAVQQQRINELEAKIKSRNPTERLDQSYSEKAEAKRKAGPKRRKPKPLRQGRFSTADKIKLARRTEPVYPDDVAVGQCLLSHTRVAWRLENGRAVLVAYEIYRYRDRFGKPPGLLGRSEFGIEIMVAIAYQVYCLVLSFFQQLQLRKSQADALLNQLAKAWQAEFESLCTLLAHAAVVHADGRGWQQQCRRASIA